MRQVDGWVAAYTSRILIFVTRKSRRRSAIDQHIGPVKYTSKYTGLDFGSRINQIHARIIAIEPGSQFRPIGLVKMPVGVLPKIVVQVPGIWVPGKIRIGKVVRIGNRDAKIVIILDCGLRRNYPARWSRQPIENNHGIQLDSRSTLRRSEEH